MTTRRFPLILFAACVAAPAAHASYHFTEIEQVIAGVKGNTHAQAIQLRARQPGQNLLNQARIRAWDAQGNNPVIIINIPNKVTNDDKGDTALIATDEFLALTNPTTVADFKMTQPIPDSYLAAGSLTFEYAVDGTVMWRISWGGAGYTGLTTSSQVNSPNGNFGTPFAGPLPSTGLIALLYQPDINVTPGTTEHDYALTTGPATFTNNSHQQFTIVDGCPNDPNKAAAGVCGCGTPDTDSDGDGQADCVDPCPNDPTDKCNDTSTPAPKASGICGGASAVEAISLSAVMLFFMRPGRRSRGNAA